MRQRDKKPPSKPLAQVTCPVCFQKKAYIKTTAQNHQLYLTCPICSGRLVGERMVVKYLARLKRIDVQFLNGWDLSKMNGLIEYYRDRI